MISIRYMLLVQNNLTEQNRRDRLFQYIICCWFKVLTASRNIIVNKDFNTLYVVGSNIYMLVLVLPLEFQYIICCWFNNAEYAILALITKFQYIICCWFNLLHLHLLKM